MSEVLLGDLLKSVSRAFYLTLRVLPDGVREPIGLAYLLARAADTIADTEIVAVEERLARLLAFRAAVQGGRGGAEGDSPWIRSEGGTEHAALPLEGSVSAAERRLLENIPQALAMLARLPQADALAVRSIVATLTTGMEMDLRSFPPGRLSALRTSEELDRYVYHVAGCVGEFWTRETMLHTPALRGWNAAEMSALGVRFGKALQLTNVLRDAGKDLAMGRCYLPSDELAEIGVTPEMLLTTDGARRALPVRDRWLRVALGHYEAATRYLLAIPRECVRLRLAVLWPIVIGLETLRLIRGGEGWLDARRPARVPRRRVYRILLLSLPAVFSNTLLRWWIARLR